MLPPNLRDLTTYTLILELDDDDVMTQQAVC